MHIFNRSISISVRSEDPKTMTVDGIFLDSHHEICITLKIEVESYTIIYADGELRRTPYTDCAQTQLRIKELIGINLNHNVRKQIQMAVGLKHGCTHITDLTLECIKGLLQAKFCLMDHSMQPEEKEDLLERSFGGSCFHY